MEGCVSRGGTIHLLLASFTCVTPHLSGRPSPPRRLGGGQPWQPPLLASLSRAAAERLAWGSPPAGLAASWWLQRGSLCRRRCSLQSGVDHQNPHKYRSPARRRQGCAPRGLWRRRPHSRRRIGPAGPDCGTGSCRWREQQGVADGGSGPNSELGEV